MTFLEHFLGQQQFLLFCEVVKFFQLSSTCEYVRSQKALGIMPKKSSGVVCLVTELRVTAKLLRASGPK